MGLTEDSVSQSQRDSCPSSKLQKLYRLVVRPPTAPVIDLPFILLAGVVYAALFYGLGHEFLPGHAVWATLLLWASGLLGALIAYYLYLPRVLGMLIAGMLMRNLPWSAVDAFPAEWGTQMRAAALAAIFLQCGLELKLDVMKKYREPAIRLAFIPGVSEAFFDGGIATALFNMPVLLGFTLGFIMKAVGPGLTVPAMYKLQQMGLGSEQGIPSVVTISASFDDAIAITGFAIFSHLAITEPGDGEAWSIAQGPLQIVFGIVGGIIFGLALACTKVFRTHLHRMVGVFAASYFLMFMLNHYGMLSGGALGSLSTALTAAYCWQRGFPRSWSAGPSTDVAPVLLKWANKLWIWVMEPILFTTIGESIDFSTLEDGTIQKSILVICTGLMFRMCMTFCTMTGMGYDWRERLFFAMAWTPKATCQAALSAQPLALINKYMKNDPNYAQWVIWGQEVLTTGIFTIVVCAPVGVTLIHYLAPKLLKQSAGNREGIGEQGSEGKLTNDAENVNKLSSAEAAAEHSRLEMLHHTAVGLGVRQEDIQHIANRMAALQQSMEEGGEAAQQDE